jgi:cobalt-zinc-cadmium efflux system membrane fusion protein
MTDRRCFLALLLLGCVAQSGCNAAATPAAAEERSHDSIRIDPGNPQLNYIKVEAVKESDVAGSIHLTGRVTFDEEHTQRLASPIDGRVTKILVALGDVIKRDQALVELSSAHVAELHAEAQKTQQDLSIAAKSVERSAKLKAEGAISDKEVAQIESDYKKAQADTARTEAQLRSLSIGSSGSNFTASLRAQIPGTVVERNILVGQEVRADATAPLITITDLGTVWVLADLYEQDLGTVAQGASINVRVPAYPGESFPGRVDHIGEVLDPMSHTVKLRCVVPNPDARLKPEMFAKIELAETGSRTAIIVSSKAILTDSDHAKVIVAGEGNVYRQRLVETGPEIDGKVRILKGLASGEKVVTEGAIFLKREMESD